MRYKPKPNHGLAFIPALILFVLIIVVVGTALIMLGKVAKKVLNPPPPYEGPTTNTPPDMALLGNTPIESLMEVSGAVPTAITSEQAAVIAAMAADTNAEFQVVVLRSTNCLNWELMTRTNTVNHQVVWEDTNAPADRCFYRPLIVIP